MVEVDPLVADLAVDQAAVASAEAEAACCAVFPIDVAIDALDHVAFCADEDRTERHVHAEDALDQRARWLVAATERVVGVQRLRDAVAALVIELLPTAHDAEVRLDAECLRAVRCCCLAGLRAVVDGCRCRHVLREGGNCDRCGGEGDCQGKLTHACDLISSVAWIPDCTVRRFGPGKSKQAGGHMVAQKTSHSGNCSAVLRYSNGSCQLHERTMAAQGRTRQKYSGKAAKSSRALC